MQKVLVKFDFAKPLMWDLPDCMEQFDTLVAHPPLHSVVVHIEPGVARAILKQANDRNRPLNNGASNNVKGELETGQFELTGDTLKISKRGRLIDGQHRLEGCVRANKGFDTHIVFGLPESVFDILDRQRTRTAADILSISGVRNAIVVAGATRWAKVISERRRGLGGGGGGKQARIPSPRETRRLVAGPMRDIVQYTKAAEAIRGAYKIPPTLACGLLWAIAQDNKSAADNFAADWLGGNRNYVRNKNFDVLLQRIVTVKAQANGHLNRTMLAAMLVQCFNHWNANVTASPRGLTWKREWAFPVIEHDAAAFLKTKDEQRLSDTSLRASQERILTAMSGKADGAKRIKMAHSEIAKTAGVPERQLPYLLRTMVADKYLVIDKKDAGGGAAYIPAER